MNKKIDKSEVLKGTDFDCADLEVELDKNQRSS